MNLQDVVDDISQRVRRKLSHARMDQQFKLLIDVTVEIDGDKPIILHESLSNKHKYVSREDNIKEIIKRRFNTMIGNISGRFVSGEYIPKSKVYIAGVKFRFAN